MTSTGLTETAVVVRDGEAVVLSKETILNEIQHALDNAKEIIANAPSFAEDEESAERLRASAKKARAEANNAVKAINNELIRARKEIFGQAEADVKEIKELASELDATYKSAIQAVDDAFREKKYTSVIEMMNEVNSEHNLTQEVLDALYSAQWLNRSVTLTASRKELEGRIKELKQVAQITSKTVDDVVEAFAGCGFNALDTIALLMPAPEPSGDDGDTGSNVDVIQPELVPILVEASRLGDIERFLKREGIAYSL